MAPSDQRGPMAVAAVAVFFRSQNRPVGARSVKSTMTDPTTSGSITNHRFFFGKHLSQGLRMLHVDAWNRLSSPTCQVRWNRFTCVERNSKLMPLETRRVSPGKRLAANEKGTWKNWPTAILAHWSCSQISRPHQEERREYQMIQPLVLGPTYRSPDVCPSYAAFRSVEALHQCRC